MWYTVRSIGLDVFTRLRDAFPTLDLECGFDFSRHTTIGCGGIASVAASPTRPEAAPLLRFLQRNGIPYCFLGAGANVLPRDADFDGVVIRFGKMNSLSLEGGNLLASAGVTGGALINFARRHRIGGFEGFTGIPMTVGGATAMNAGVSDVHISDLAEEVLCVEKGKERILSRAECAFGRKKSVFSEGIAVLGVRFRAEPSDEAAILLRLRMYREKRKSLPKGRSMGCAFVNPEGVSAGALIDRCGLKGLSVGGAHVSKEHANFILSDGATAEEIEALVALVKRKVFTETGILLEEEFRRLP